MECESSVRLVRVVESLTSCHAENIRSMAHEFRSHRLHSHIRQEIVRYQGDLSDPTVFGIMGEGALLPYILVRLLKPNFVIETGVSAGFSTAFILSAMERNGKGALVSIDFPIHAGGKNLPYPKFKSFIPTGLESGWLVPESYLHRWNLFVGKSIELLPKVMSEIGEFDLFIHDSEHTESNMLGEFEMAWKYLRKGGVLLADDVCMPHAGKSIAGDPFQKFARSRRGVPYYHERMGCLVKA